jgi:hypothetical protein
LPNQEADVRIIRQREHKTVVSFYRYFERRALPGSGFIFDCNEAGDPLRMNPCSWDSYHRCLGNDEFIDYGIQMRESHCKTPAVGLCEKCGREVWLDSFTCSCQCGADYNMSGQRLAGRSQWGEETGESVADILFVDSEGYDFGRDY